MPILLVMSLHVSASNSIAFAGLHNLTDLRRNAVQGMKKKKGQAQGGGTKGFSSRLRPSEIFQQMDRFCTLAAEINKPMGDASTTANGLFEVAESHPSSQARAA